MQTISSSPGEGAEHVLAVYTQRSRVQHSVAIIAW